jgi:hypothetical protein
MGLVVIIMAWQTPVRSCIDSLRYPERMESQHKDIALAFLRHISGKDFGEDISSWEQWAKDNKLWDLQDNHMQKRSNP